MCKVCDSAATVRRAADDLTAACRARPGQIRLPWSTMMPPLSGALHRAFARIVPPLPDFDSLLRHMDTDKEPH